VKVVISKGTTASATVGVQASTVGWTPSRPVDSRCLDADRHQRHRPPVRSTACPTATVHATVHANVGIDDNDREGCRIDRARRRPGVDAVTPDTRDRMPHPRSPRLHVSSIYTITHPHHRRSPSHRPFPAAIVVRPIPITRKPPYRLSTVAIPPPTSRHQRHWRPYAIDRMRRHPSHRRHLDADRHQRYLPRSTRPSASPHLTYPLWQNM